MKIAYDKRMKKRMIKVSYQKTGLLLENFIANLLIIVGLLHLNVWISSAMLFLKMTVIFSRYCLFFVDNR